MKHLHQVVSRGRATLRRLRAVAPGPARSQRPVRLVLRLPAHDDEAALARADWQALIVETVTWLGPVRVCLRGPAAQSPLLVPLVRFANRLECPTHLITAGPLAPELASALIDAGLAAATVRLGSLDEAVHLARTGTPQVETLGALEHLRLAREDRGRRVALLAGLCLAPDTTDALGAMAGLARQSGVDGVLASLPCDADVPPGAASAVAGLGDHCTPPSLVAALSGGRSRAPLGLRLEVSAQGMASTSRRVAPLGPWQAGELRELWGSADEQIAATLGLDRPADEIELVPRGLYSTR